jgi:hypothetical protein
MTPEEKAVEIVGKFMRYVSHWPKGEYDVQKDNAKQCALICVDEILSIDGNYLIERTFWQKVKQAIIDLK